MRTSEIQDLYLPKINFGNYVLLWNGLEIKSEISELLFQEQYELCALIKHHFILCILEELILLSTNQHTSQVIINLSKEELGSLNLIQALGGGLKNILSFTQKASLFTLSPSRETYEHLINLIEEYESQLKIFSLASRNLSPHLKIYISVNFLKLFRKLWTKPRSSQHFEKPFNFELKEESPNIFLVLANDIVHGLKVRLSLKVVSTLPYEALVPHLILQDNVLICEQFTLNIHKINPIINASKNLKKRLCHHFVLKALYELFKLTRQKVSSNTLIFDFSETEIRILNIPASLIERELPINSIYDGHKMFVFRTSKRNIDKLFPLMNIAEGKVCKELLQLREISF